MAMSGLLTLYQNVLEIITEDNMMELMLQLGLIYMPGSHYYMGISPQAIGNPIWCYVMMEKESND